MVRVNMQITHGLDADVDQAMASHLVQHVVEERQAGICVELAATVEIHRNLDLSFLGVSFYCCYT